MSRSKSLHVVARALRPIVLRSCSRDPRGTAMRAHELAVVQRVIQVLRQQRGQVRVLDRASRAGRSCVIASMQQLRRLRAEDDGSARPAALLLGAEELRPRTSPSGRYLYSRLLLSDIVSRVRRKKRHQVAAPARRSCSICVEDVRRCGAPASRPRCSRQGSG